MKRLAQYLPVVRPIRTRILSLWQGTCSDLGTLADPAQPARALALAFATGTLLGFLPVPVLDSLVLAFLLARSRRLSRPAVLAGKMVWNELLVLPLYGPALRLGDRLVSGTAVQPLGLAGQALDFAVGLLLLALLAAAAGSLLFVLLLRLYHGRARLRPPGVQVTAPGCGV